MLCQNCGKNEANVKYTQIINGVKKELTLCSDCARKLGIEKFEMPINFGSFLGDFFGDYAETEFMPSFQTNEIKCKKCGMTYDEFINTGMFGCSECYDVFSSPIESLLKNLHGTAKHVGRVPKSKVEPIELEDKISESKGAKSKKTSDTSQNVKKDSKKERLERDLEKAINEERYEDAAKIRDELKEMNK